MKKTTIYALMCAAAVNLVSCGQEPKVSDVNFDHQSNSYSNIIKVSVTSVIVSKNPDRGYPFLVEAKCVVDRIYKGVQPHKTINVIVERESAPNVLRPTIGTYFFFYNDEDKIQGNVYSGEFRILEFSEKLESRLENKEANR